MSKKKTDQGYDLALNGAKGIFRIALYICVALVILIAGRTSYTFGYAIFNQEPMESGEGVDVTVVIQEPATVSEIAKTLKNKGLIENTTIFSLQEKLSKYKGKLEAGTYILSTSMTADDIMAILSKENVEGQPSAEEESMTQESRVYDQVDRTTETDTQEDTTNEESDETKTQETTEDGE